MSSLVVADSEYAELKAKYGQIGSVIETQLESYCSSLSSICDCAVKEGLVYENLCAFLEEAKKLQGLLGDLTTALGSNCDLYVESIDANDTYSN